MKINTSKSLIIFPLLAGMALFSCKKDEADPPAAKSLEEKLQEAMDKSISANQGMGLSLAVILPDGETLKLVSGKSREGQPVTTDMLFSAGSITKMFTACTMLKYCESGLMSLDDTAGKWLPPYPNIDGSATIRQLLNHTSGIFNVTENPELWQALFSEPQKLWQTDGSLENYVLAPSFEKGTDWGYSNTGYLMLRRIIELVSGNSVAMEYRNLLLDPAGLENTYCYAGGTLPGSVAAGWFDIDGDDTYDEMPYDYLQSFYSAAGGGIFASAEDLALWIRRLLSDKVILSEASLAEMLKLHTPTQAEDLVDGYGLGIYRFSKTVIGNHEAIGHGGDAPGYAAGAIYLTDYQVSIGIADNTEAGNAMPAITEIIQIIADHMQE